MLMYHSKKPRALKKMKIQKSDLDIYWRSNKKSWVTRVDFISWIVNIFGPSVEEYLTMKNLPKKVLLLVDNAPGHPKNIQEELNNEFNFIKFVFLPPNTTSLIQPMDQMVISNFKKTYLKLLFEKCFETCDTMSVSLKTFWSDHFNIVIAIKLIIKSWDEITSNCLKAAWGPLCPYFNNDSVIETNKVMDDIMSNAKKLNLEINQDDVQEFIDDENEFSTDELQEMFTEETNEITQSDSENDEGEEDLSTNEIKHILSNWRYIKDCLKKWKANDYDFILFMEQFEDKSIVQLNNLLRKRQHQSTIDMFFKKQKIE